MTLMDSEPPSSSFFFLDGHVLGHASLLAAVGRQSRPTRSEVGRPVLLGACPPGWPIRAPCLVGAHNRHESMFSDFLEMDACDPNHATALNTDYFDFDV